MLCDSLGKSHYTVQVRGGEERNSHASVSPFHKEGINTKLKLQTNT